MEEKTNMTNCRPDRAKVGAFVAALRKEKGLTQKQLAEKLSVSDKTVSKWERGGGLPDISMLIPLAGRLGVSVSELLAGQRLSGGEIGLRQTENLVKSVIKCCPAKPLRAWKVKTKQQPLFLICAALAAASRLVIWKMGLLEGMFMPFMSLPMLLSAAFGAYFCFFAPVRLPDYYDENEIGFFYDGIVRMNMPGISFNNRNWPGIMRVVSRWCAVSMAARPPVWLAANFLLKEARMSLGMPVLMTAYMLGLFVPIYIEGNKYR